jgi:hypothetical protein
MPDVIGAWFALAGALALLAGLSAMHRVRRLRRGGLRAWATVVPGPAAGGDGESAGRPLIQYAVADGRVIERICPAAAPKVPRPVPGERVLVRYDPADPEDAVVFRREGQIANSAFAATGVTFVLIGVAIAAFSH